MREKKSPISLVWVLVVVLVPSLILNIFLLVRSSASADLIKVIGVVDGDTVVLEGKVKVRLRHVDAPELDYCGGAEAKKALEDLVVGKHVVLSEQIPDQYGRSMAIIRSGKEVVNLSLLETGWVRYHHDTTTVSTEAKKISSQNKEKQTGIYGACQSKEPIDPSCVVKGNIDKGNNAKKYYIPGCAQYAFTVVEQDVGESWFCTEKDAMAAGYTKAETCEK